MNPSLYEYRGAVYPTYLRDGNASQFIAPAALHFCKGKGLDVGGGKWPLPGAFVVDLQSGGDAMKLPEGNFPFVFSSHCLEHLANPVAAIEHWKSRLIAGGVLFLYLPHADGCRYWRPQNCRNHLHAFRPRDVAELLGDLGFVNVIRSEGWDAYWSFMVVAFTPTGSASPDAGFRALASDVPEHIRNDAQLSSVFKTFGAEAFRRSSAWEPEFETIIKAKGFRGGRCVEIGTYSGMTALVLARYFDEVVSLDIFPHTAKHTIAKHLGVNNIRFIDVKDNAEKAKIIGGLEFDAAYVDGDHEHDTETDFALVKRCGKVLFHEYWQTQMPVWDLINRLRASGGKVDIEGKFALWRRRG